MTETSLSSQPQAIPGKKSVSRMDKPLVIAWLVSVGIHVILFSVMVAVPWISQSLGLAEEPRVTTTAIRNLPQETKVKIVPLESAVVQSHKSQKVETKITPQRKTTLRELSRTKDPKLSIMGIGTGGGEFSKYGLQVGPGGSGPEFFGLGGDARAGRRIVYVVDRSGSMLGIFDDLQKELKRSIDQLRKSQKYHVIFYSTDPPIEAPPGRLVNAIRASKERTFEFIDGTTPEGMTHPLEAMKRAFTLKPDIIYFLSDGVIPEGELLKEELRTWNRKEKTRIYCIAYVNSGGKELLEDIAREHNGAFRFVSEYDLED